MEYINSDLYEDVLRLFPEYHQIFSTVWASELWFYNQLWQWKQHTFLSDFPCSLSVPSVPTFHRANLIN